MQEKVDIKVSVSMVLVVDTECHVPCAHSLWREMAAREQPQAASTSLPEPIVL